MNKNDIDKIHRFHRDKLIKYGPDTSLAQGWKNKQGQIIRFEVLSSIGNLNNCSLLDAGCGYGDLCGYLNSHFKNIKYFGIDLSNAFLDAAIEKYSCKDETCFFLGDFTNFNLPVTDYILLSGALNYYNSEKDYAKKAINKLYNSCRIGFGFNLLGKINFTDGMLCTFNKEEITEYCKNLCTNINIMDGYYEDDFTVMMYR